MILENQLGIPHRAPQQALHIELMALNSVQNEMLRSSDRSEVNISKGVQIRNRYNQVPHLTQDTNVKLANSQLDTINESQEVSPFPAGYHQAQINRRLQRHNKHKTEKPHKRFTKEEPSWNGQ